MFFSVKGEVETDYADAAQLENCLQGALEGVLGTDDVYWITVEAHPEVTWVEKAPEAWDLEAP